MNPTPQGPASERGAAHTLAAFFANYTERYVASAIDGQRLSIRDAASDKWLGDLLLDEEGSIWRVRGMDAETRTRIESIIRQIAEEEEL